MRRPSLVPRIAAGIVGVLILLLNTLAPVAAIEAWRLVVRIEGRVESLEPGQASWAPIFRSRRLNDGAMARTQAASTASINLADQSSFRLGPNSEVEMTKFQLTPEGRTVVLNLRFGQIRADVAKALGRQSRFEVRTPNGVLAARGTSYAVTVMPEKQGGRTITLVRVFEGEVEVSLDGTKKPIRLGPGDHAIVSGSGIQINAPGFPFNQTLPSGDPSPNREVHSAQAAGSTFQSGAFQATQQLQFERTYFEGTSGQGGAAGPGGAPGQAGTAGGPYGPSGDPFEGNGGDGTPPIYNPSNIGDPIGNTPGGGGGTPTTGTVNIIIR